MRCLTIEDGDLLSQIDEKNKREIAAETEDTIKSTSLKNMLINNQITAANKRKFEGQLAVEHILRFCISFEKVTKNLGFHIT